MYTIGVDLGGTNIAIGIVNEKYEIVRKGSVPTKPERGADPIIADMAALCRKLIAEEGLTLADIESVGVATPGTANNVTGVVEYANNIPFLQYPLADRLSAQLDGKKVYIENDANAAAKAEAIAGVAAGAPISVMITLGTGVGGGIIIDGKVYTGFNFAGAELGHVVIQKDGRQCSCGRKGCWEAYSSATGLVNITKDYIVEARAAGKKTIMDDMIGGDLSKVSARTAFNAMKQGDEVGAAVVDEYISYLSCGIVNMINIFQPNVLSIGGGVCNEGDYLMKPLLEKVWGETYTREGTPRTQILIAKLGNDAGIIGAAVLGK
ncbi:MAG: ROK family protein [Eubacteriales bacterium]|nr:ROK family protein [Clostridiales bacterium]MDD7774539.1 ROK family protein [Eubacteriales bacterium]MDY3942084.1 ROK family protein [Eubacteriales bacterium]